MPTTRNGRSCRRRTSPSSFPRGTSSRCSRPCRSKVEQHAARAQWLPLVIIVLAQLQMAINVSVLPVSLGPISEDLHAPATATATALLLYSLFVAAFVMLGAKIGKLFGERLVFQVGVAAHGLTMVLMAISTNASTMNTAQVLAGIVA